MNDADRKNLVMVRPGRPGHVESFFFKVNDPSQAWSLWVKFTILTPSAPGAEPLVSVWATRVSAKNPKRGLGIRNTIPLGKCRFDATRAGIVAGPCEFGPGFTRGRLRDAMGQTIAWDLTFDASGDALALYPGDWMYRLPFPRFKAASPYVDTRASGWFDVGGKRREFADLPAMQGHNWGNAHAETYAWMHCNAFDQGPGIVFEGFSAKIRIAGWQTPFISAAALRFENRWYRFNGRRALFARDIAMNRQSYAATLHNDEYELRAIAVAHRQDFAGLMYPNPDFTHRLCVNSGVANVTVELANRRTGDRLVKLTSPFGGMLELISPANWCDVAIFVPPWSGADETGTLGESA